MNREDIALQFSGVRFSYPRAPVFLELTLGVPRGQILGLLGPNGSGKTTLVRLASGGLRPDSGTIRVLGHDTRTWPSRDRARCVAVVPQQTSPAFEFSVFQMALLGRAPHQGLLGLESDRDLALVREALRRTDILHLADRPFHSLSGGERQRVVLARALAQEAPILLLDEPTAFLDLRHRLQAYHLLRRLNRDQGMTVILVSHDLNLASRYCDRLVLLRCGEIVADGAPEVVVSREHLRTVYEIEVDVREDPATGRPYAVALHPSSDPDDS
jgi:iron complex transport system ATP-binding protein